MSLQDEDVSLRLNSGQTDRAAEHVYSYSGRCGKLSGWCIARLATLYNKWFILCELAQNPGQARKTIEKIARTFFTQPDSKLAGTFVSVLSSSLAWTGRMSEQTALEIFVSVLFGMLIV
ncbi:MAG: hypothetical protein EZS28_029252 [Streblomastix strix]|uniref:Uncharacterized protein n=1 Tax=Streblomastix strix TaxID=222440 RepID=A0A5J4UYE6_9EUKA|nr:MAG: hypothetical protein EZS28_029252 [Streblomastix strix]